MGPTQLVMWQVQFIENCINIKACLGSPIEQNTKHFIMAFQFFININELSYFITNITILCSLIFYHLHVGKVQAPKLEP